MPPTLTSYLSYLFKPFFRSWWAALTGCASLLALYVTPSFGVTLTGAQAMTMTFIGLTLVFLTLSVLSQGWALFTGQARRLRVSSFERNRAVPAGWVFVLDGGPELPIGTVIDVHKRAGSAEVPLALIEVVERNSAGAYQATPIGKMNPAHIAEHAAGGLKPGDLIVRMFVNLQRMKDVADDIR